MLTVVAHNIINTNKLSNIFKYNNNVFIKTTLIKDVILRKLPFTIEIICQKKRKLQEQFKKEETIFLIVCINYIK